MRRMTLDEIHAALSALARDCGVEEITITARPSGADGRLRVIGACGVGGWARDRRPRARAWSPDGGDQDLIDRVLARGEHQP